MKTLEDQGGTLIGHQHPRWKGMEAGYKAKHMWIAAHYGRASECEDCGTTTVSRYEWANISGDYHRERSDYKQLCPSCHRRFDNPHPNHCRRGHEFNAENTYWYVDGEGIDRRQCRHCQRIVHSKTPTT